MRSVFSCVLGLAAFAGISAGSPAVRRNTVVSGATYSITTWWTGNETLDATLDIATKVSTAIFSGNLTELDAYIADDFYGLASPSMAFNHSVFVGHAGLTELASEGSKIWAFNFVEVNVYPLAPGMVLVKHWDPNAKAVSTNETVPYDDIEIGYVRDGQYVETKPYYWDPYEYMKATVRSLDKGKGCHFGPYEDALIATKKAELSEYNSSFTGF